MPASKSLFAARAGEWRYGFFFTGVTSCLRTIRKGSTVTCPRSVLFFENRCLNLHWASSSASVSWGYQTALSRPNRIIRRYSGIRDHSLLNDLCCCGSSCVITFWGGWGGPLVSLVFLSSVRVACCGDVESWGATSAFTRFLNLVLAYPKVWERR